jgi:hypothetical protein
MEKRKIKKGNLILKECGDRDTLYATGVFKQ